MTWGGFWPFGFGTPWAGFTPWGFDGFPLRLPPHGGGSLVGPGGMGAGFWLW